MEELTSLNRRLDSLDGRLSRLETNQTTLSSQITTMIERVASALDRLTAQERIGREQEKDFFEQRLAMTKEYVSSEQCKNCSLRVRLASEVTAKKDVFDTLFKLGPMIMVIAAALIAMYVSISSQQAVQTALQKVIP